MKNLKTKLVASVATAALLATSIAPASFAATNVKVKKNGRDSFNLVGVKNKKTTKAYQTNNTTVLNLTGVFQNTGGNKTNDNNGDGNVDLTSGGARSTVTNDTTTGGNDATIDSCGCESDTDVTVASNGRESVNIVGVHNSSYTKVSQTNNTTVVNGTLVGQNTGGNKANDNNGDGNVDLTSGGANSTVTNTVTTGGNSLTL